jgi:hypothetical protein
VEKIPAAAPCKEQNAAQCTDQVPAAPKMAQLTPAIPAAPVAQIPAAIPCKEQNANQGKQVPFCDTGSIPAAAGGKEQCAVQAPSCGIVQEGCATAAESDCHDYVKVRFTGKGHITHSDRIGKLFKNHPQAVSFSHHPKIGDRHEHVNVKCMVTYLGNF